MKKFKINLDETSVSEKSSPRTRQTDGKNLVWFGEIERKLAKLSMPTCLTVLPLNYLWTGQFYDCTAFPASFTG
jgi:hypothetical protein